MTELALIRCYDDLVEAFRARKDELKLSNEFCDSIAGLTRGHTDKVLGPTRAKNLSGMTLDIFLELLGVEIVLRPNMDAVKRMEARYEARNGSQFRPRANRISKELITRAKPLVMKGFGQIGGQVRAYLLSPEQAAAISRKAGRARARKLTRKQRQEIARKGGLATAAKRRLNRCDHKESVAT